MSYSSLPLSSKLFQLTSLTCALALAGCGGGDGTDTIAPAPDLGVQPGTGDGNGDNGGGDDGGDVETPVEQPFNLQKLYTTPTSIKLGDEPVTFTVTVKAVENATGAAAANKPVSLSVEDSQSNGVTIQGESTQTTDARGEATYELKLNPLVLSAEQKTALLTNGFSLTASADRAGSDTPVTQLLTVSVSKEGSGEGTPTEVSDLNIESSLQTTSVSNNEINPYGDMVAFSVVLKNTDGARAEGVTVGMAIADVKGIAIVGGNNKTTDENGVATFALKVNEGLTKTERDALLKGVVYAINIAEDSGATKKATGTLPVSLPVSDYKLAISGNASAINAYGDTQRLTINASAINNAVPTSIDGAKASIKLNNTITGVSLSTEALTFNANGQALADIIVAPTLSAAERTQLAKDGISYTVTLSEPNRATTVKTAQSRVEIPQAQYQIKADSTSKTRISSFGSSVVISFRVNDKDGGAVAGQKVTASLPSTLTQKGLLNLDSAANQVTDAKGEISYTVSIPKGLSADDRALLENAGGFVLTAQAIETSGASSQISSSRIQVTAESETILSAKSTPSAVNVLKDQFSIQVAAKRPNGSAASDKEVTLTIDNVAGVSIEGNKQTTDASGAVSFTINLDQNMSAAARNALVKSGIPYTVTLTDDDGVTTEAYKATVIMPVAEYQINTTAVSQDKLVSTGDDTTISFRVNDKNGGVIAGQTVTASLPSSLTKSGLVTLKSAASQQTDAQGVVSYTVSIPEGLSAQQRAALEASGFVLSAALTESSGVTIKKDSKRIAVNADPSRSTTLVTAKSIPGVINVLQDQFSIQIAAKRPNGSAAADKPVELIINDIKGISIAGNKKTTNSAGTATFTVNIDPSLSLDEREALAASGIAYQAILTDDDGVAIESYQAAAAVPTAQYAISFGQMSSTQLSSMGGTTTVSFRVNDKDGGVIAGQRVTARLPQSLVDAGVLTLDDSASQTTDSKGTVSFNVRVPTGLNTEQKALLENNSGFVLSVKALEASGASSTTGVAIDVTNKAQQSKTVLKSQSTPATVNILKDSFTIQVSGKRPDGSSAADKVVKLTLGNVTGLSVQDKEQTTDSAGNAVFTVNIDPSLDLEARKKIAQSGIAYTAILTDDDGVVSSSYNVDVTIPAANYELNFGTLSNSQLSSSGGSTSVSFRVNDKNGGVIAGQPVTVSLPDNLAGLLTLDSNATKPTNEQGEVSFTVRVPTGLSAAQKAKIEQAGQFSLTAVTVEDSEVKSEAKSGLITLSDKVGQSSIQLVNNSSQPVLTTDKQFVVTITGKYPDSSAAADRAVKLELNQPELFTIVDANQNTDKAGNVSFTINIKDNLSEQEINALVVSGISYTATIIDNDGTQAQVNGKIKVAKPATTLSFASVITPSISEFGGEGVIKIQLLNSQTNKAAQNQAVSILLGKKAQDYGVTVNQASNTTDFNGETTFIVSIPEGLSSEQRDELQEVGINYQLSYVEKGETYTSEIQQVTITTPAVDLTVLNNPNLINNRPFYTLNEEGDTVVVSAGLSTQNTSFGISGQPVQLDFANKELAALLNVNGKLGSATNVVSTDANGAASFTVIVPNNLTADQKAALNNKKLVATLTETLTGKTQEIQFNVQSTKAAIDLIAITSEPLNLNGGETQVEVIAQDSQENVIAGQTVFLALPAAIAEQGVRLVSGKEQTTNNSGVASYTLAVPAGLTQAQKDAIGSSFVVALSAADKNGNIATQTSTVTTTTPAATGTTENLTIGANKVVNTKGDSFKVFVRVADEDGAVNGRVVRLNVDDPIKTGVTVANGTATTNSDGVATFDLTLEAGANVNQALLENGIKLTATTTTAENTTLEQNYIVAVDTSTIDNYQILVTSDKSTLTTGGDQTNAVLRVTDSNGGILAGVPVQLSIANLVASGAALTTPSMVTTDANGKIDVGVLLAANSINARLNHDIDIEAKIVTPTYDVNGDVSLEVREQKTLSLSAVGTQVDIAASKTKLQDNEAITITTTVIDGAAQAISNAAMELIDADGDLIAPMATATTNSDGQAVFEVSEDQLTFDNNGNLQVYARALGEGKINTQRSVISINLVKVSQAGISFIDINDVYDVTAPQTINVQIRTDSPAQAQALIGQSLEVQTTLGTFANNNVITTKQITADNVAGNIITVQVTLTSELAGTSVLQATVLGLTLQNGQPRYQTTIDTRFRATTPTKMLFQPVKSVITPGSSTEVVATVKDKNDVPVEGQTVVFSRAADSSAGRLSAATAITDSKGEARVVYQANASSPIGGVVINARLLNDPTSIGTKTTNITVSKEAVYTTLAFANKLSSDDIYYTVQGSISVMDGSGRAVADKEVSIKSYATQYAQGRVCLLNSNITYQKANEIEFDENGNVIKVTTPEPQTKSEAIPVFLQSGWKPTEDSNYNYTLDKDSTINEDSNNNGSLEAINPVAIIGGTVSDDGYTFVTDSEGRADFSIRYPMRYSNWVKVRFDATTFLNGSENMQSINYQLPSAESDLSINSSSLETPWIDNASPFGVGGAACVDSMNVTVNENTSRTRVVLSPYTPNYNVQIDGEMTMNQPNQGYNSYIIDFSKAYEIGSTVTVNNNGFGFSKVISVD